MKLAIAILGGALGMFFVLVIIGMMTYDEPTEIPAYPRVDVSDNLGAEERTAFMEGCTEGDTLWTSYCGCVYDWVDDNFTNEVFMTIVEEAALGGDLPQELLIADEACEYLVPSQSSMPVRVL